MSVHISEMDSCTNVNNTNNCLSLIRLLAAIQVIFFHLVTHLHISIHPIVDSIATYFRGVPIFFILSGFLIWFSIERSSNYKQSHPVRV